MALSGNSAAHKTLAEYPDILNVEQVAQVLDVSTKTVYKLLKEKRIRSFKSGREFRIHRERLAEYMESEN